MNTVQAKRAAEKIVPDINHPLKNVEFERASVAEIIDRETLLPELLRCVENLRYCDAAMSVIAVGHRPPEGFHNTLREAQEALAAIDSKTR